MWSSLVSDHCASLGCGVLGLLGSQFRLEETTRARACRSHLGPLPTPTPTQAPAARGRASPCSATTRVEKGLTQTSPDPAGQSSPPGSQPFVGSALWEGKEQQMPRCRRVQSPRAGRGLRFRRRPCWQRAEAQGDMGRS